MAESKDHPTGYVGLREYFDIRIAELDRHIDTKITAINTAVEKAEKALSHRLDGMNEIREAMRDTIERMTTKEEVTLKLDTINQSIRSLEISRAYLVGVAATVSAVVSITIALVGFLLK